MQAMLRAVALGGIFLLPLISLVVMESLFFPYVTGKAFAFRIIVEVVVAAWIILALYDAQYRPRVSLLLLSFAAFLGVMFVANLSGVAFDRSVWSNFERMEGFVTLVHLFAFFVAAGSVLTSVARWRHFFIVSLGVATVVAFHALGQVAGIFDVAQGGSRVDATLGNAIYLAVYMLFHIFMALIFILDRTEHTWMRIIAALSVLLFCYVLVQTGTRGAALGLVAGIVMMAAYGGYALRHDPVIRRIAVASGLVVVLLASGLFLARDTAFVEDQRTLNRITSISLEAGETRMTLWGIAVRGAFDRPLLGWGQENFNYVFNAYYEPSLYAQETWFDRVHNVYLDWLVAGGILGLLAYLLVWVAAIRALLLPPQTERAQELLRPHVRAALLGLLAGYAVHSIFVFDNVVSYFLFASILAFLHAASARTAPIPIPALSDAHLRIASGAVGVVLILVLYVGNIPQIGAARDIINATYTLAEARASSVPAQQAELFDDALALFSRAADGPAVARQEAREQLALAAQRIYTNEAIPEAVRAAYRARAVEALEAQVRERPEAPRGHVLLGSMYRSVGDHEAALGAFEAARTLSPRKQHIRISLGVTQLSLGAYDAAYELFRDTLALDPRHDEARVHALVGARLVGDRDGFEALSAEPHGDLYVSSNIPIQLYFSLGLTDELIAFFTERIAHEPENLELRVQLAALYLGDGDADGALRTIRSAMEQFPGFEAEGARLIQQIINEHGRR